eukprot:3677918-Prymnesium_polylepis.1
MAAGALGVWHARREAHEAAVGGVLEAQADFERQVGAMEANMEREVVDVAERAAARRAAELRGESRMVERDVRQALGALPTDALAKL